MKAAGVALRAGLEDLAVMGVVEVARRLGWFRRLRRSVLESWRRDPPDAVLLVDYPGFNLRLARDARRRGLTVVYYVTPTVWAWNERRVATLRSAVDECLVILPFEEAFLRGRGVRARFVGHPLARQSVVPRDRRRFLLEIGVDPGAELLALLPGSRVQEVRALAGTFFEAGRLVRSRAPRPVQLAFGAPTPALANLLGGIVGNEVPITVDRSGDLLASASAAIAKSGTVTVEAALLGTPLVVGYRMSPLTLWLARRLVRVEHVAMVNILRGRRVVPELLQSELTPAALAEHALRLLAPVSPARDEMLEEFARLRTDLLRRDAPREVARAVRAAVGVAAAEAEGR